MKVDMLISNAARRVRTAWYRWLDRFYLPLDRQLIRRTRNLRLLPEAAERIGGKFSYAEWAHVIGIFQTLFWLHLEEKENNQILDVGCGTGLLGIAAEPFLGATGRYVGVDVSRRDLDFCRRHYPSPPFEFVHLDVNNPFYAPDQAALRQPWPLGDARFDLVSALSVWTHFKEEDAVFYFAEIARVLKPGAKAIVTFFLLDPLYFGSVGLRTGQQGRFHMTSQGRWVFDQPVNGSDAWFHPRWAAVPENAIGVTQAGLNRLIAHSGLELVAHYQGNWKEVPGVFFQDVLVFRKR
jgi:SAM-dependent methyltransferase